MTRFTGKTVLVTGGSKGIGKACCQRFLAEGASVHLTYAHDATAAQRMAAQGMIVHRCDQADPAAVADVMAAIGAQLDVLVLNAAYQKKVGFADTDRGLLEQTFAANIHGNVDFLQRFIAARRVAGQGGAAVVHSSNQGELVNPSAFAYALSKAALNHLVRHAARASADIGVRVNGVILGWYDTEGERAFYPGDQIAVQAARGIPLRRAGTAEEAAAFTAFLASEEAAYITGSLLRADGGFALAPDLST